jgi:phage-related protein
MQGVVDLSHLLGHRVYENRDITYVFYRFGVPQNTARDVQSTIENLLMREFDQQLHDSFEPDFHYLGKCREVVVEDEFAFRRMRIQISFDLYPFKVDNFMESADLFDPFNFDLDAFQRIEDGLSYRITGERNIQLYNSGQKVLVPTVAATGGSAEMTNNSIPYGITGSARQYPGFRLLPGMNEVTLRATEGSPTVSFDWRKERI